MFLDGLCDEKDSGNNPPEAGDDEAFNYPREERKQFIAIANNLRPAFDQLEQTHKAAHGLTGPKKVKSDKEALYAGLVAGRRALALQEYPRPSRAAAPLVSSFV